MIKVAVPGGSSEGLGRAIVTAIQKYPGQLEVIVLSRESSQVPEWLQKAQVEVRKVDYNSESSLYEALQGVHTIICTLLAADGTWASTQRSLLHAGLRAGVKRFAPAEFGVGGLAEERVDVLKPCLEIRAELQKVKANNPAFEYAAFHTGLFMNYLGYGAPDEKAATHAMKDTWVYIWDVKNMKAAIPLTRDGKIPSITLTEIGDVGRFAAAACLLPEGSWQEDFSMVGETLRMDDVVKKIEEVRGGKMEVSYRSYEQIAEEEAKEEVFYPNKMWLQLELVSVRNKVGEGITSPILNRLCPSVKPISVEEYLRKFWT